MSLDLLFTVSSVFAALIGLGALIAPTAFTGGSLPGNAQVLIDSFRGFGGLFLSVAILDWMARGAQASRARNGIVLANAIGFLFATVFTTLAVLHGYPAWGWILVALNALLALGYILAGARSMSTASTS